MQICASHITITVSSRTSHITITVSSRRRAPIQISDIARMTRPSACSRRQHKSPLSTACIWKYAMIFRHCDQRVAALHPKPFRHSADLGRTHFPANKQTTWAALLRQPPSSEYGLRRSRGFGGHPASRFGDVNPAKRLGAKQDGGGGRTRTCEAIRRLIYSQLPLPLGTLPHFAAWESIDRASGAGQAIET